MAGKTLLLLLGLTVLHQSNSAGHEANVPPSSSSSPSRHQAARHRQKRVLWITNDGRIALPPGTVMTITPTLAMPFVRYPPYGFLSNMTISLPFTIDFDKLGLTDNENPYGALPSAFDGMAKSRQAGVAMADFIAAFVKRSPRDKRDTGAAGAAGAAAAAAAAAAAGAAAAAAAELPKDAFHGGERALLYGTAEDMLSTLGMNGKACLLRAICEVQGHPLDNFGLIGEMLKLFLTASKSPFANLLQEYVEAENRGRFHGECWPYFKHCPKSLFLPSTNKYTEQASRDDEPAASAPRHSWNRIYGEPTNDDVVAGTSRDEQNAEHTERTERTERTVHPSM